MFTIPIARSISCFSRLILTGGVIFLSFIGSSSWACDPPPGRLPATIAERVASTAYVFEATVTQVNGSQVTVAVSRYFKGHGPDTVAIESFNRHTCDDFLQVNDHFIFFAEGDFNAVLSAVYDNAFGSVRSATPEIIAEIEAALEGCFIYALQDEALNDSQLLTLNPKNYFELSLLGPQHLGHDLEGLAIHPQTQEIYVSSGDDAESPHEPGFVYTVNSDGHLTHCGSTGFNEVSAISFQPDGTLWGWAEHQGLIQIDIDNNCTSQLVFPHVDPPFEVEAMTWDTEGEHLYGIAEGSETLFVYQADSGDLSPACDNLPTDVEALGLLADGSLLMGLHHSDQIAAFNPQSCTFEASAPIETGYRDIEGIAWLCQQS